MRAADPRVSTYTRIGSSEMPSTPSTLMAGSPTRSSHTQIGSNRTGILGDPWLRKRGWKGALLRTDRPPPTPPTNTRSPTLMAGEPGKARQSLSPGRPWPTDSDAALSGPRENPTRTPHATEKGCVTPSNVEHRKCCYARLLAKSPGQNAAPISLDTAEVTGSIPVPISASPRNVDGSVVRPYPLRLARTPCAGLRSSVGE
jgi:hypothetical protein